MSYAGVHRIFSKSIPHGGLRQVLKAVKVKTDQMLRRSVLPELPEPLESGNVGGVISAFYFLETFLIKNSTGGRYVYTG